MTSILKTDEIQSQNGGSVVKIQTLKHPSASGNNLELASDGSTTITNGTISAGTIGDNVAVQSSFGVTDKQSIFEVQSICTSSTKLAFAFNGFMFVNLNFALGSNPQSGDIAYKITDANFRPTADQFYPTQHYAGDEAQYIQIKTNGDIVAVAPVNPSGGWNAVINGWYRFA